MRLLSQFFHILFVVWDVHVKVSRIGCMVNGSLPSWVSIGQKLAPSSAYDQVAVGRFRYFDCLWSGVHFLEDTKTAGGTTRGFQDESDVGPLLSSSFILELVGES